MARIKLNVTNWLSYGRDVLKLREPFTNREVIEEIEILNILKIEKRRRDKNAPKTIELSGAEFIGFCERYNAKRS